MSNLNQKTIEQLLQPSNQVKKSESQGNVFQGYKAKSNLNGKQILNKDQLRKQFEDDEYSVYSKSRSSQQGKRVIYKTINNGLQNDNISVHENLEERLNNQPLQTEKDVQNQKLKQQRPKSSQQQSIYRIKKQQSSNLQEDSSRQNQDQQQQQNLKNLQINTEEQDNNQQNNDSTPMDQALFESVSNNEWAGIIPDEILLDKNIDLNRFIEENQDYFDTLKTSHTYWKNCTCGNCKLENSSAKMKYLSGLNTTYNRDFYKKNIFGKTPYLTDAMMATCFGNLRQLDQTYQTQKNDFQIPNKLPDERIKAKQNLKNNFPVSKLTSYNQNFIDWADYDIIHWKSPIHVSTSQEIPFHGKTTYQDNFSQVSQTTTHKGEAFRQTKKGPLPSFTPFIGQTEQMSSFQPFKIQSNNGIDVHQLRKQQFQSIPSYNGQFLTTVNKDFVTPAIDICPMKKIKQDFRKETLRKLERLRDSKIKEQFNQLK